MQSQFFVANDSSLKRGSHETPSAGRIAIAGWGTSGDSEGGLVGISENGSRFVTNSGAKEQTPAMDYSQELKLVTATIREPLIRVEALLREQLRHESPEIQGILDHVAEMGGKRLRPALLLLAAQACGKITEEAIRLAVVVELVHTATLVHDDILDGADSRRHRETVHRKWNRQISILAGDWLFTQAYFLANQGESTIPGRWIAQAAKEVCEGEIRQNLAVKNFDLKQPEYFDILGAKTGSLCGVSCKLGAWAAGASEAVCNSQYEYGMNLGLAFQIHDDWLDYWGTKERLGKPVGGDFLAAKPTLPMIHALGSATPKERENLLQMCSSPSNENFEQFKTVLNRFGASDFTKETARAFSVQAIGGLRAAGLNGKANWLERLAIAAVARAA
jgi:octaprenyl-diphosphate synthase